MWAFGVFVDGVDPRVWIACGLLACLLIVGARRIYFEVVRPLASIQLIVVTGLVVVLPGLVSITTTESDTERGLVTWSVRVILWLAGALVLLKMVQLFQLSRRYLRRRTGWTRQELLPPQLLNAQQILRPLLEPPEQGSAGRLLPYAGDWGDGKTFVLRYLTDTIEAARPNDWLSDLLRLTGLAASDRSTQAQAERELAAILECELPATPRATAWIDIWQHSTDIDLHTAIVSEILCHPAHARRLRWLSYPPVIGARIRLGRVVAGTGRGSLEVEYEPPRLRFQAELERLMSRSGTRTMIVLDEIDRASPNVTQTALTLCRRSLDVPQALVVFPYVERVLHMKAFSEWYPKLDDIETFLWKPVSEILDEPESPIRRMAMSTVGGPAEPTLGDSDQAAGSGVGQMAHSGAAPSHGEPFSSWRRQALVGVLDDCSTSQRLRIYRESAEKFLSGRRIHVGVAQLAESFDTIMRFEVIKLEMRELCRRFAADDGTIDVHQAVIASAGELVRRFSADYEVRNLRVFVTDLVDSIHRIESVLHEQGATQLSIDELGRLTAWITLELYEADEEPR